MCKVYCTPDATFAAQAEPLAGATLAQYADWMKGLMTIMPDGRPRPAAAPEGRMTLRVLAAATDLRLSGGGRPLIGG